MLKEFPPGSRFPSVAAVGWAPALAAGPTPAALRWCVFAGCVGAVLGLPDPVSAQDASALITRQLPYPSYRTVGDDHYGLKIGGIFVRYDLSVTGVYTDNRNFSSSNQTDDFGVRPSLNLGLFHQFSERQKVQFDVGIGYQWWENSPGQNRLYIAPNSHLDYVFGIGEVQMRLSNSTSTSSEASSRPEFSGGNGQRDFAFSRISNSTALTADVGRVRHGCSSTAGIPIAINRSLNNEFGQLDRNTHNG